MAKTQERSLRRKRTHRRVRARVSGTSERPRLSVYKSSKYIYAQVIDDLKGETVAQASSSEPALRTRFEGGGDSRAAAKVIGETVAERAREKGIERVVFDRGGYIYHGRIKAVADGAREKGLEF